MIHYLRDSNGDLIGLKHTPIIAWLRRNIRKWGPNPSGNLFGIQFGSSFKIMLHRPHINRHTFFHIQIEVRVGGNWRVIGRIPLNPTRWFRK